MASLISSILNRTLTCTTDKIAHRHEDSDKIKAASFRKRDSDRELKSNSDTHPNKERNQKTSSNYFTCLKDQ